MFRSRLSILIAQKQHYENRRITQQNLALDTGLARATISKWMSPDSAMPRLDGRTVHILCSFFECSLEELVDVVKPLN